MKNLWRFISFHRKRKSEQYDKYHHTYSSLRTDDKSFKLHMHLHLDEQYLLQPLSLTLTFGISGFKVKCKFALRSFWKTTDDDFFKLHMDICLDENCPLQPLPLTLIFNNFLFEHCLLFIATWLNGVEISPNTGWTTTMYTSGGTVLTRQAELVTAHGECL